MKIKSRVWHWLAVACGSVGLLYGMGLEGNTQIGAPVSSAQFTTAFILILLAALFMKLGFIAQEREEREATPNTLPCRSTAAAGTHERRTHDV